MSEAKERFTAFNSALETGIRALILLAESFPASLDLQRILEFDYLVVHSGDVGGPPSLHPALPLRSGELIVRRHLIERGLLLMMSRGLIDRTAEPRGFMYRAADSAGPFLDSISAEYLAELKERASWVARSFGEVPDTTLRGILRGVYDQWTNEFVARETPVQQDEL